MTQDQHKLESCPFCGKDAGERQSEPGIHCIRHSVYCGDCMAEGPVTYDADSAITAWNTRAHLQQRPLPVRDDETMRAEFTAWVESQGCDTDGAWSAWQGCWNLLHGSVSAVLIPAKHWDKNVVHEWSGPLPVIDGTERDALRYRWLRDTGYWYTSPKGSPWAVIGTGAGDAMPCCGQELDAAIDAGMADMPPASPSLPVREEPTPEQVEAGARVLYQDATSLGDVGWGRKWARRVYEVMTAPSPSVQNMGEGETGKDGAPPSGKSHQWEDADDLTLARAEVLSLVGLLAELGRMEAGNADDALGGYCGAPVADFKRRCREAVARNGGVDLHDGAQR